MCPYLAFEACRQWRDSTRTKNLIKQGRLAAVSMRASQRNYKKALEKGVLKILSKMGISLLSCYHGAQVWRQCFFDFPVSFFNPESCIGETAPIYNTG